MNRTAIQDQSDLQGLPIFNDNTLQDYLNHWANEAPDREWLIDRKGDQFQKWTWSEARAEISALAAYLESLSLKKVHKCAILSRNCAHWVMADLATVASGGVTVPLFTTLPPETAQYILEFAEVEVLFVGASPNWEQVKTIVPEHVKIISLPEGPHGDAGARWDDLSTRYAGKKPSYQARHDDLMSIVFTSGTTGLPKGVMQTHDSMLVPMERGSLAFSLRNHPRLFSYLPMAHIAERQLVLVQSLIRAGSIYFNESLETLARDMADACPNYFFGAPRVWEQLQQAIIAKFGSQEALEQALGSDPDGVSELIRKGLGLDKADYLLTAAAPTPASLIHWYERLGLYLKEGYEQTEAMGLSVNTNEERRIGSIGKPVQGVDMRIADNGELLCKAPGLAVGYYRNAEKTAETFVDGWVHTGDKARVDEDGFYYITGRVKDYFKTIQGKFVSPIPIEDAFSGLPLVEQQCLLGRGYSKTVMLCVLSANGQQAESADVERRLIERIERVNDDVEKHARIGAVIVSKEPWSIENGLLTPTLKMRREQLEQHFGSVAESLARESAERGKILCHWFD